MLISYEFSMKSVIISEKLIFNPQKYFFFEKSSTSSSACHFSAYIKKKKKKKISVDFQKTSLGWSHQKSIIRFMTIYLLF